MPGLPWPSDAAVVGRTPSERASDLIDGADCAGTAFRATGTRASAVGLTSATRLGRLNTRGLGDFQRRDLFPDSWVDADSVVEIFLGGATSTPGNNPSTSVINCGGRYPIIPQSSTQQHHLGKRAFSARCELTIRCGESALTSQPRQRPG